MSQVTLSISALRGNHNNDASGLEKHSADDHSELSSPSPWTKKLLRWGVEYRGIHPVPIEERNDTQFNKIFFLWFSMNFNILSFSAGTLGPVVFHLGLRDSCLVILFFNLLCAALPSYLSTWGPKLGLRQMIQARFSFGYYGVIVPCVLNLIVLFGFCILSSILGGQTLAAVAGGNLSWSLGIVVICALSLLISFCGYRLLNWYERIAWIPLLVVFIVALGLGGGHLKSPPPADPATPSAILTYASTVAGFVITFATISSDFTIYFRPDVSSIRIFTYSYLGLLLPIVTLQCLGAAVAISAPSVPDWEEGYTNGNVGGLLEAMLRPTSLFGKILTVLLSLSVMGNIAATFYSITLNAQILVPVLVMVPRYVFSVVATAIVIPLAIIGSHRFYDTLVNFLGLISYWAGAFGAIVVLEHLVFRGNNFASYDVEEWNQPGRLPWGAAALVAGVLSFGLVIPSMDQVWFIGPIARHTGDIGFEVAFAVSALLFVPCRALEIRWRGKI